VSELKKVWRGEIGLVVTYWLWGVLVANILLGRVLGFIVDAVENEFLSLLHLVFVIAVNVFATVAIWHSAANYKGQAVWAVLARLTAVVNVLVLVLAALGVFDTAD
jgi:hypothetical protein